MSEITERVLQLISALFNVDVASLSIESSNISVPGWDSMGQLMLVLELEQQFGVHIPPDVGEKLHSVAEIVRLLENI